MIGVPFNDHQCLTSITELISVLVEDQDPTLLELARRYPTVPSLVRHIRDLPQRDDDGEAEDGPRVDACVPSQRVRLPATDPNCVERAALYLAVAEIIDPEPVRQLATLDTPIGLHTFPVENGAPVILDPRVPEGCIDCGLALHGTGPVQIDTHDAIRWTADLASAHATQTRNGPTKVRRARNAVSRLMTSRVLPSGPDVEAIGFMFAVAEQAARRLGARAVVMVQTTAQAIAEITEEVAARAQRNLARNLARDIASGVSVEVPTSWMRRFGQAAVHTAEDIAPLAIRSQLDALGIGPDILSLVEEELNREGLTLGPVASPTSRSLPAFATVATGSRTLPN